MIKTTPKEAEAVWDARITGIPGEQCLLSMAEEIDKLFAQRQAQSPASARMTVDIEQLQATFVTNIVGICNRLVEQAVAEAVAAEREEFDRISKFHIEGIKEAEQRHAAELVQIRNAAEVRLAEIQNRLAEVKAKAIIITRKTAYAEAERAATNYLIKLGCLYAIDAVHIAISHLSAEKPTTFDQASDIEAEFGLGMPGDKPEVRTTGKTVEEFAKELARLVENPGIDLTSSWNVALARNILTAAGVKKE